MGGYVSRPVKAVLYLVPVVISILVLGIYKYQRRLIYPSDFPPGSRTHVDNPGVFGMPFEDVTIDTVDGEKIKAFVICHEKTDPSYVPKTVLMLNPNAGNIGHSLPLASIFFRQMGYNVVLFSYRGYGHSSGEPSEAGIKKDADAVLKFLEDHPIIGSQNVVLYGRSLGGAVAFYMASKASEFVRALVIENTFLSIPKLVPNVLPMIGPLAFLCTEKWETENLIKGISSQIPTLFLRAGKDELIPGEHMIKLHELCPSEEKHMEVFPEGTHNDTPVQENYFNVVHEFIAKNVSPVEAYEKGNLPGIKVARS